MYSHIYTHNNILVVVNNKYYNKNSWLYFFMNKRARENFLFDFALVDDVIASLFYFIYTLRQNFIFSLNKKKQLYFSKCCTCT